MLGFERIRQEDCFPFCLIKAQFVGFKLPQCLSVMYLSTVAIPINSFFSADYQITAVVLAFVESRAIVLLFVQ